MRPEVVLLAGAVAFALAAPASAQMDHSNMPGMKMPAPAKPAVKKVAPKASAKPAAKGTPQVRARPAAPPAVRKASPRAATRAAGAPAPDPHAGHDMNAMPGMQPPQPDAEDPPAGHDMKAMPGAATPAQIAADAPAGHDMSQMEGMETSVPAAADPHAGHDMGAMAPAEGAAMIGTNLPAGNAPAPPVPTDYAADRVYSADNMAMSRHHLYTMHGGQNFYQMMFNLAEYQARPGRDGFRWDGEAWYGGDINRLWIKTEGDGDFVRGVDEAEVQALYSRAIGPYFNVQGGVRYDFKPNPSRAYAALGIEGLAPSFFDVEAFAYLSNKGDVLVEFEGTYDQRITQRLILQPRAELNFAAQDIRENGIGSGLSTGELGLRLRYDIRREFAPYVGISYERSFGDTARFARAEGGRRASTNFVLGLRTWF